MDAVKFAKAQRRMCKTYSCNECPLKDVRCRIGTSEDASDDERIISIVEKWDKENPAKTRQSEFLKLFPNATLIDEGAVDICPMRADSTYHIDCVRHHCPDCKMKYWSKEVE